MSALRYCVKSMKIIIALRRVFLALCHASGAQLRRVRYGTSNWGRTKMAFAKVETKSPSTSIDAAGRQPDQACIGNLAKGMVAQAEGFTWMPKRPALRSIAHPITSPRLRGPLTGAFSRRATLRNSSRHSCPVGSAGMFCLQFEAWVVDRSSRRPLASYGCQ